ncbi:hypothetical protein MBLNU459_g0542t1 [Dothideomycetes sp. NU459]
MGSEVSGADREPLGEEAPFRRFGERIRRMKASPGNVRFDIPPHADDDDDDDEAADAVEKLPSITAEALISHSVARLIMSFGTRHPELTSFSRLSADEGFEDIQEVLQSHEQSFALEEKLFGGVRGYQKRLPAEVLLALSMNDHTCRTDTAGMADATSTPGRMRHAFSHKDFWAAGFERCVHFSLNAFTSEQRHDYSRFTPIQRLKVSSIFMPYHWTSAETRVVPVRLMLSQAHVHTRKEPSPNDVQFVFYVEGSSIHDAREGPGRRDVVVLLWINSTIVYLKMSELLSLPIKRRGGSSAVPRHLRSGPEIIICRREKDQVTGMVQIRLMLYPKSHNCLRWIQRRTVDQARPIEALRQRLMREITSRDPVAVEWGTEYDRLLR